MNKAKYTNWYNNICARGKVLRPEYYLERHHIVPESFYKIRKRKGKAGWLEGDSDSPENITWLTAKEHAIAHHILTKMYRDDKRAYSKVIKALEMMGAINHNQKGKRVKLIARVYARAKEERARLQCEAHSGSGNPFYGKNHTMETIEKIKAANTGRVHTQQELDNQKAAFAKRKATGKKRKGFDDEYKKKRSEMYSGEKNPRYGVEVSDETRKKIGDANRGRKQSDEEKQRRGEANKGKKRDKKFCEWCGEHIAVNTYPRFHGPNCKSNPDSPRFDATIKRKIILDKPEEVA